jgi:hypothetical protein
MHVIVHNHFHAQDANVEIGRAVERARRIDPLSYLKGVKRIVLVPDRSKWNATYNPNKDQIELEAKFRDKSFADMVQTVLHEAGHRGQYKDKKTYEAYKALGLNREEFFFDMANKVHLEDFKRIGKVDSLAAETFGESYARFALKMDLPEELREFWQRRVGM